MRRNNGKTFAPDFALKSWRKCEVARTGLDPQGEAELHEIQAEQKLLDLTREAAEAEKAARAAEAAAEAAEEARAAEAAGEAPAQAAAAAHQAAGGANPGLA